MSATVDPADTTITLQWMAHPGSTSFAIHRRSAGATSWGAAVANLPGGALQWTDNNVVYGSGYEYKVVRSGNGTGYGYVRSGIAVPEVDFRGKLVLLVESGIAPQLAATLDQLVNDLNGDGWLVLRHDVLQTATPQSVRALVAADHAADPTSVKAVYIVGNVPVPYSGNTNPDGHGQHQGAWASDTYYGEVNGTWTDGSVNATGGFPWNINTPGDGKFDQNDVPGVMELAVGRVDLSDLPAFAQSEVQLLQSYLDRAHAFKTKTFTVPHTAVMHDDLQWVSNPLASSGFMSAAPCVGPANITELFPSMAPFIDHYANNDHLFTYHCGSGLQSVDGFGNTILDGTLNGISTAQLATNTRGGVFNMSFGSYYGDWDNTNNMLRGLIASGNGLTHVWSAIPNWFLHPLAMGEPIGHCALRAINNTNTDYSLQNGGWQGQSMGQAHMALMGDPSLRMQYIAPPSGLIATNTSWYASFSWSPSPEPVDGYLIYAIDDVAGTIARVTPNVVTDTFHVSNVQFVQGRKFMVRAVKLATTPSGSYYDLSLGAIALAQGTLIADCFGVVGGSAIPGAACDDGDANTGADVLDSLCNCAGLLIDCTGMPGGAALPGTTCDDGNALTVDDVYDAACDCIGILNGIDQLPLAAFNVSPNPAHDVLRVTSATDLLGSFTIASVGGAILKRATAVGLSVQLDLSGLAPGNYVLIHQPSDAKRGASMARFTIARQ